MTCWRIFSYTRGTAIKMLGRTSVRTCGSRAMSGQYASATRGRAAQNPHAVPSHGKWQKRYADFIFGAEAESLH